MQNISEIAKKLDIKQNVSIQVLDRITGDVVQEVSGHNAATNSLLYGVAHHLIGDFMPNERHGLNPGYSMLSNYVPRYISLGTMGLLNQEQDSEGLPAGIGDEIPSIVSFELGPFVWVIFNQHGAWPAIHRRSDLDDSNYLTYNRKGPNVFVWDNNHGMIRADY